MSKNLNQNQKHFDSFHIQLLNQTLNDNSFSDITFNRFVGVGINRFSNKEFGNSSISIESITCK